ncbi:MAG: ATP-dependent DNA helicase RecG [Gammaproteobacteria bacterium]|nr:ATP-dependent DNA helicase RecG [Gammaproteobacteria bacterium]MBT7878514.1 ATP-dependent DNA helicase RecG [Gammaproteobacteria bacterium]
MPGDLANIDVTSLKGVGPALGKKLAKLGIQTVQDILFHLPFRYEDRTQITPIGASRPGESYVLQGEIVACEVAYGRRRSLLAYLQDNTGKIGLRFYHFSKAQHQNLKTAGAIRCFGEVRAGASGLEIYHPEYSQLSSAVDMEDTLTPVYPATEGVSQARYRLLVTQSLDRLAQTSIEELLPDRWDTSLSQAITYLHHPPPDTDVDQLMEGKHPAQTRLAFEELTAHQVSLRIVREQIQKLQAPVLDAPSNSYTAVKQSFGFALTGAQQRVADEVAVDLMKSQPSLRLIQGDVGSGKTVIAALASVHSFENNLQTALMAPTELLAEQHFINMSNWLAPLGIKTAWLSGRVTGKKRVEELARILAGDAAVIIGTHALFQKDVQFRNLGLVIVDEQHRFGVHQRLALRAKGSAGSISPHQLVMTATPIPRTLSMSIYADMDVSVINELPPGRTPVTTTVMSDEKRDSVISRVADACTEGRQVYWVCTLIEESEALQCQAAEVTEKELEKLLPNVRVGLVHGRMAPTVKTDIMNQFKSRQLDLLVATTVIEVGVDVPNASLMVIENSERLGLAQLHQLRGRIGRGTTDSHCVLLYRKPLGNLSKERLEVMRQSNDGFFIAERDLEIRGPGELLGARQSGTMQFRIADLLRDQEMLPMVREASLTMMNDHRDKASILVNRWIKDPDKLGQV